jgi:hypothetical protein
VEAVDVLHRGHRVDDALLVDAVGERELDEQAVDRVVGVQLLDEREQLGLGRRLRQPHVAGLDAHLLRRPVLAADVDVRGRVVADEDGREADVAELGDLGRDVRANPLRKRLAVHEGRRHDRET